MNMKQGMSAKKSPKDIETTDNVQNHMDVLQRNPERVKKYFKHKTIEYAA